MQKLCFVMPNQYKDEELDQFRKILDGELTNLSDYRLHYDWIEDDWEGRRLFTCRSWPKGEHDIQTLDALRHHVSTAIAEYLHRYKEKKWLHRILIHEFHYNRKEEINKILAHADQVLNAEVDHLVLEDNLGQSGMKEQVCEEIKDYFNQDYFLNLDGFIKFRLKKYWENLRMVVEHSVDEYLIEREYQEFIQLLRYFISIQEPKMNLLHVFHKEDRQFLLYDEDFSFIRSEEIDRLIKEFRDLDTNYEDLIVSTLITIAPRKVILHTKESSHNIIHTIMQIFQEKIEICSSCFACDQILKGNMIQYIKRKE